MHAGIYSLDLEQQLIIIIVTWQCNDKQLIKIKNMIIIFVIP